MEDHGGRVLGCQSKNNKKNIYESGNNCQAVAYNDEEMDGTIFDRPTSMFFIRFGLFHATKKNPYPLVES